MAIYYTGFGHPKGAPQILKRRKKKGVLRDLERLAKAAVWKRAGGKCERCGKRVQRSLESLQRGEVHHRKFRSAGGTWNIGNLELLCPFCHAGIHQRTKR